MVKNLLVQNSNLQKDNLHSFFEFEIGCRKVSDFFYIKKRKELFDSGAV